MWVCVLERNSKSIIGKGEFGGESTLNFDNTIKLLFLNSSKCCIILIAAKEKIVKKVQENLESMIIIIFLVFCHNDD